MTVLVDDSSPVISYHGPWTDSRDDPNYVRYLNQTFHATQGTVRACSIFIVAYHPLMLSMLQASASFSFNGTGVYLYGAQIDNHGTYTVEIDGKVVANNNGYGNEIYQALLYSKLDLPYALHTVVLTNTGAPSWLDLDFVTITTGDGRPRCVTESGAKEAKLTLGNQHYFKR
jgi:hypothetical protein